jgi:hypothetical protein
LARQNYQHGKRQRELAKKQKREEKLQRKLNKKSTAETDQSAEAQESPKADA